jgi:polyphosphate glucokinase
VRATGAPRTLAVDVGGTALKLCRLGPRGVPLEDPLRVRTPVPATPAAVLSLIRRHAAVLGPFERVGLGFPGVVARGIVLCAPNLSRRGWRSFPIERRVATLLGRPCRVANDAVVQGYGAVRGRGLELLLTLGTGLGSALFLDGRAIPLELGHLPWRHGRTYEEEVGQAGLRRAGRRAWSHAVGAAVETLRAALRPDVVYLGGGNTARVQRLPHGVRRVDNVAGLLGCSRLWSSTMELPGRRHERTHRVPGE